MPFAVEMYFDPPTEGRVRRLWASLAGAGLTDTMRELGARPHVSLAAFPDLDPDAFRPQLQSFAAEQAPLPVSLAAVGAFPGAEGVVYVSPIPTQGLLALHRAFHAHLGALSLICSPYYRPGQWMPHCTVGMHVSLDLLPRTMRHVLASDVFSLGTLTHIGLIEYRPVRELYTFALGALV